MKVDVNGILYTIIETNNNVAQMNDGWLYGKCCYFEKIIYLNQNSDICQKKKTLAHELAHAFIHETQAKQDIVYSDEDVATFIGLYNEKIQAAVYKYFK